MRCGEKSGNFSAKRFIYVNINYAIMQKRFSEVLLFVFMLAIFVNIAYAAEESFAKEVWDTIVWLFSLGWITEATSPFSTFVAFARLTLSIVTWVLVFELLNHTVGTAPAAGGTAGGGTAWLSRKASMVISIAIAIMVAVFFPTSLLLTIVTLYGAFVAFVMVAVPVGIAIWLAFALEIKEASSYWIRIVLLIVAIWLLRIISRWARFTVLSGGTQEFIAQAPELTAEQSATFLTGIAGTLSTLTTMADFGSFILILAIVYNISGLMGAGETATRHGGEFIGAIGEALKRKGARWVEEKAIGIEFPELKRRIEPALNDVATFLRHVETQLENILIATKRPSNIPRAVQDVLDTLDKPLHALTRIETVEGYDTTIEPTTLPDPVRKNYAAAITGITPAPSNGHEAFRTVYANLAAELESNLLTQAGGTPADRRRYMRNLTTRTANCIYIINALLAYNRLQYKR